jgi:hypothetical protein
MIGPGADAKVLVCTQIIDGRKGLNSRCALIENGLGQNPCGGIVYIFRKQAQRPAQDRVVGWLGSVADDQARGAARRFLLASEARWHLSSHRRSDGGSCFRFGLAARARATSSDKTKNPRCICSIGHMHLLHSDLLDQKWSKQVHCAHG